MTSIGRANPSTNIKARQISEADVPAAVALLKRGYGNARTLGFWKDVLDCLTRRSVPPGLPRYGYVIEYDGNLVGIMLLIFSTIWNDDEAKIRCCGSSVYVDPAFRLFAPLLTKKAHGFGDVTVLNLTPAKHTHRMIELAGFQRFSSGIFVAIPLLSRDPKDIFIRIIDAHTIPDAPYDQHERDLLLEHVDYGCKCLWCVTPERAFPFVFRIRRVRGVPCVQLVYCRNINDFARFARPIGWFIARNTGRLLVLLDANGPVPELIGRYFPERAPRYYRGPDRPRLGDLAHTEVAMFGF